MNLIRLANLAAACVLTVAQWAACLGIFSYAQPMVGHGTLVASDISTAAISASVVNSRRL